MTSFWAWRSGTGRIQDLKASELATHARTALQKLGKNARSARLIYRALRLDPYHPEALLIMSEIFRGKTKGVKPVGDEIFATLILEYATDQKSPISIEHKRFIDNARLEVLNLWGFATTRADELDVDHLGYMSYIHDLMAQVRTIQNAFHIALHKLGIQGGILNPATGKPTSVYKEWLASDASTLLR